MYPMNSDTVASAGLDQAWGLIRAIPGRESVVCAGLLAVKKRRQQKPKMNAMRAENEVWEVSIGSELQ